MSTHGPDDSDDWVKRYRQASDSEAPMPSTTAREAILAEGRRVAAERAANPTTHRFDPKQQAANQPRWKLAAAGTVGAALLAAVLMFPHAGSPPSASLSEMAPAPAVSSAPLKQSAAPEPTRDGLENGVVSDARPAAPREARQTQAALSRDAAPSKRRADLPPRESQDAARNFAADAQSARTSTSAAPPASPAAPAAVAGQALRSNVIDASLPLCIQTGDLAHLGALLNEGANPQQIDLQGRTPLLLAVIAHREDMVELLLAHHANPNAADHTGETPLKRARHDHLPTIIHLLERAGAH